MLSPSKIYKILTKNFRLPQGLAEIFCFIKLRNSGGDIVSFDRVSEFVQRHERISVNLQITRITKHVSSFDFEDEYEEI